jgi:TonB-dependent starch-binding outer membrane protein SusC
MSMKKTVSKQKIRRCCLLAGIWMQVFSCHLLWASPYKGQNGLSPQTNMQAATTSARPEAPLQLTITGKVTDDTNTGLPGVNVLLKGTNNGTTTNAEGNYSLTIPDASSNGTLIFSYIGYTTEEVPINGRTTLDIALVQDIQALSEVVVVGYGTQEKKDVTGAIASVSKKDIAERPTINVLEALSGKVAGLNIHNASGRPGGRVRINVRGMGSINASTEPLYVIDGMIGADITLLDPNDIESIDVLKDASATAIYGSRGANGVILVTTKGAKAGSPRIEYRGLVGVSRLSRQVDVLNASEFMEMRQRLYDDIIMLNPAAAGTLVDYGADYPQYFNPDGSPRFDTNWQEEATRNAVSHRHYLNFSGGSDKFSGGVSLGRQDEQGILLNTYMRKNTARLFGDFEARKWLKLGVALTYGGVDQNRLDEIGVGATSVGRHMVEVPPFLPVKRADGNYTRMNEIVRKNGGWDIYHGINAVALLEQEMDYQYEDEQILANLYADFKLAEGLTFRTTYARKLKTANFNHYRTREYDQFENFNAASVGNGKWTNWQVENFLNYEKQFGTDHNLSAVAGASWLRDEYFGFSVYATNFADEYFRYYNVGAGRNQPAVGSGYSASKLNSYYARANYSFKDKYLLTATGRYDGSSRFGTNNKYAFFPSVALGWRVSEEGFLADSRVVNQLKIRGSYGVSGNSAIGDYTHLGQPSIQTVIFNKARVLGSAQGTVPNDDLQWEKTSEFNVGFDLNLLDRISLETNLYLRKTTDLLFNKPISAFTGYFSVLSNIGSVQNKGLEVALTTQNIRRENFRWSSTFLFSTNKNKILALGKNNEDVFLYTTGWGKTQVMRVGEEIASFWGYTRLGIWGTDEAEEAKRYNRIPGDIKLLDVNNDGRYDDKDAGIIGSPFPDYELAINNTFTYKNWNLSVDIRIIQGADIADASMFLIGDRNNYGNTYTKFYRQAWTPENQNTMQPRVRANSEMFGAFDTRHIFDGSFIRGQNLALSYTLPQSFVSRLNINGINLFVNAQNFFLIDSYHGFDPEVSAYGGQFSQGLDLYSYPKSRVFNFGVNLSL